MLAYKEWYNLFNEGKLNDKQSQFFEPRMPEHLYKIELDPHEVNNLANSDEHQEILIDLRKTLNDHLISSNDLSFFPEPYFLENGISDVTAFSQKNKDQIKKLLTEEKYLDEILLNGFEKADKIASKKVKKIHEIIGF